MAVIKPYMESLIEDEIGMVDGWMIGSNKVEIVESEMVTINVKMHNRYNNEDCETTISVPKEWIEDES